MNNNDEWEIKKSGNGLEEIRGGFGGVGAVTEFQVLSMHSNRRLVHGWLEKGFVRARSKRSNAGLQFLAGTIRSLPPSAKFTPTWKFQFKDGIGEYYHILAF